MKLTLSNRQLGTVVETMMKMMDACGLPLMVHGAIPPRSLADAVLRAAPRLRESDIGNGQLFVLRTACYDIAWSVFEYESGSIAAFVPALHEGNATVHNLRVEIIDPIGSLASNPLLHFGGGPATDPKAASAYASAAPVSADVLFGPSS
ncbi:hypothetical protein JOD64_001445 [Micromonospora luteifusca]|uniref:Uncharacterized protein n=1 Tax=Micromonospora luteifusca TaxID=709860 RepID=A0ABS2LQT1_9ACTN|nr:hypothetical protein [Micromonospora luteifusca]MBM7490223.1 hypothetical protein [Micromonospora luteifusca]